MGVFQGGGGSITPAFRNVADIIGQRTSLEATRPHPFDIGTGAFNVVAKVGDENRAEARARAKEEREFAKQNELEQIKQINDLHEEELRQTFQMNLEKYQQDRMAQREASGRAFDARDEVKVSSKQRKALEKENGLTKGTLGTLDGVSIKPGDLSKILADARKTAATSVLSQIQQEPDENASISSMVPQATYGMTPQGASKKSRTKSALIQADPDEAMKRMARAEFDNKEFMNLVGSGATPTKIKGYLLAKQLRGDPLTPEEQQVHDTLINDPYKKQAMELLQASGLGLAQDPEKLAEMTDKLADKLRAKDAGAGGANNPPPQLRANIDSNVSNAIAAINSGTTTREEVETLLKRSPTYAPFAADMMAKVDAKVKRK